MSVTLEFSLRPADPAVLREDHLLLVYCRYCEFFFDDAAFPCVVNVMAVEPGFMLTKDESVQDAVGALDVWEEIMHEERRLFWLSVTTKALGHNEQCDQGSCFLSYRTGNPMTDALS